MINMMVTSNIIAVFLVVLSLIQCSSTKVCVASIPGANKLIVGVDVTKLDLIPLKGYSIGGFRAPIFQLTCNKGNKYKHPSGATYDLPDQIWGKITLPAGRKTRSASVLRTYDEVKKKLALEAGLSVSYGAVAFSASASYKRMKKTISENNKEIIELRNEESAHKLTLYFPSVPGVIDPSFHQYLERYLKGKTFKSNRDYFKNFIKTFGTHYSKWGEYGGVIRKYMETASSYSKTKTDKELKLAAEASYDGLVASVKAKIGMEKSDKKVNEEFESSTSTEITYHGGEANLIDTQGINYWQQTVDNDPVLFKIDTGEIYSFITDASLKSELTIAIDDYVMRSFIEDIITSVGYASAKWNDPDLDKLITKANELKEVDVLGRKEVLDFNLKVEHHIKIPKWFLKDTLICFSYQAMRNGHTQCNGKTNKRELKTMCAAPNSYTERYHDNTGTGSRGCWMHWGIRSAKAPKWFKETQLCFKSDNYDWRTGKDHAYYCAHVNKFTGPFFDNTWKPKDKTWSTMRWTIVLTTKAPVWLRKSKLCLKWEPFKNRNVGQCIASSRTLCAKPGEYTPVYTDKTSFRRNGGCFLKWAWYLTTDTKYS